MAKNNIESEVKEAITQAEKICGIIMPISDHDGYPKGHWNDVLEIITQAVSKTEFESKLVSDDVAIGLIHERIVTNLYNNEIVICDVSSRNPNVMFELGLRLAFDKPTIIIKDERTKYSFDTAVIEHLDYPSTLRFGDISKFKVKLIEKLESTVEKKRSDPNFSPFLKSFGRTIIPAKIEGVEIPEGKFILSELQILKNLVLRNSIDRKNDFVMRNLKGKYYGGDGYKLKAEPILLELIQRNKFENESDFAFTAMDIFRVENIPEELHGDYIDRFINENEKLVIKNTISA